MTSEDRNEVGAVLRELRSGDPDRGWAKFVDSFGPVILQVVRLFEQDNAAVDDCFMFVCEQLVADRFKRLRKYSPQQQATFVTWLRSVVRNLCIDYQRKASGRKRPFKSISRLSEFEQEVYRLHLVEGFSLEQARQQLRGPFHKTTTDHVSAAVEKIYSLLSPRQLWLLSCQGSCTVSLSKDYREPGTGFRDLMGPGRTPEELLVQKEELRLLSESLAGLSAPERRLLRLRFQEESSLQSCADVLGLGNPQRVHRRIAAILSRLRALMST